MSRFVRVIATASLGILCFGTASASGVTKPPASHHGYRWGPNKLLCTNVLKERRANDTVTIRYKGVRYWCSRPPGSSELAQEALRYAIQAKLKPGATYGYQAPAEYSCPGSAGVYRCSFKAEHVSGTAVVTFKPKPVTVFTAFVCSEEMRAYSPAGCTG